MDRQLVEKILSGDKDAFRKLYEAYVDGALRTAVGITKNRELAKDAVQETFIRAYRNLKSFDVDKPFKPWFYRILINECSRLLGKEPRVVSIAQMYEEKGFEIPSYAGEDYSDLYAAIQSLEDIYRIPIVLKYLQGFSEREIAELMELNQNTVKSRLFTAREKLRKKLEACERRVGFGQ